MWKPLSAFGSRLIISPEIVIGDAKEGWEKYTVPFTSESPLNTTTAYQSAFLNLYSQKRHILGFIFTFETDCSGSGAGSVYKIARQANTRTASTASPVHIVVRPFEEELETGRYCLLFSIIQVLFN